MTGDHHGVLRYDGVAPDGHHGLGVDGVRNAADLARHLFDEGWSEVGITDDTGRVVGRVNVLNGDRNWWGESPDLEKRGARAGETAGRVTTEGRF